MTSNENSWPRCPARILMGIGDTENDCVLPRGHEYDGDEMHLTSDGRRWYIGLIRDSEVLISEE